LLVSVESWLTRCRTILHGFVDAFKFDLLRIQVKVLAKCACLAGHADVGPAEVFIQVKKDLFDDAGNNKLLRNWTDRYVAWVKKQAT